MDNSSIITTDDDFPDISLLSETTIFNSHGDPVALASLFERDSVIVLSLIRHWNCGSCQSYVEQLGERVPLEKWSRIGAQVVVIGHGEAKRIDAYNNLTHCPFEIYADPKRNLYTMLKLGEISGGSPEKNDPSYHKRSSVGDIFAGIKNGFKMKSFTGAGAINQLGGEYIFKTDSLGNTECVFARKMPNVRSHTEPEVLYKAAQKAARALRGTKDGSIVRS